jgi:hypothetical protein
VSELHRCLDGEPPGMAVFFGFGTFPYGGCCDPAWEDHDGGRGHRDAPEWSQADGGRAEAFYAVVHGDARMILDLMIDHPGGLLDADWITDQIRPSGSCTDPRHRPIKGP